MKTTLFDLWNGNLCPVREYCKNNEKIDELEDLISKNGSKLSADINARQRKRFEIYNQCIEEYLQYTNEEAFYYGISLAFKIINEIK
ncbi:MAG: hypothetical protein IKU52_00015 [Clostridia bacterium]|nr:hypothetical protein [Clostridia bacterium]